jgi:hypothetical protein
MESKKESSKSDLSRRQFMKGAGALALAGVAGLAGFNLEARKSTSVITKTATVTVTSPAPATSTAVNTAVVPTTSAPSPTSTAVTWPVQITGQLSVSPTHAPVGGSVTASGTGFAPNAKFDLMWQDVTGSYNVANGEYSGRTFTQNWVNLAPIQTDAQGDFKTTFKVPEGFGFAHDLDVLEGGTTNGTIRGKLSFAVDMQATVSPSEAVLGAPITVSVTGMGWSDYQNGWHLHYDNQNVGLITAVSTHGSAEVVIPATGDVGKHILRVIEGGFTVAYLNHEECPFPDTPTFNLEFTLKAGTPVMPPPFSQQTVPIMKGAAPPASNQPQIWTDTYLAPVGTATAIKGTQMPAGAQVDLNWFSVLGNRVTSGGWAETKNSIGSVTASGSGTFDFPWSFPDNLGGIHRIEASIAGTTVAQTNIDITPSAISITPASGPAGTVMHIVMKGVGWTVTENNYYFNYDNSFAGYCCGFTSNGTVNNYIPASGTPGYHFIDFWPGIYKGTEAGKIDQFRQPMLSIADHPGEKTPVLRYVFQVTG